MTTTMAKNPSNRTREQTFMNALLVELCKLPNTRAWRRNAGRGKLEGGGYVKIGTAGHADIWGVACPAIHFEVECKVDDEPLTKRQEEWRQLCVEELGIPHVVARWRATKTGHYVPQTLEHAAAFWAGYIGEAIRDTERALSCR